VNCDVAVSPLFIDAMPCLTKLYHVEVRGYCNVVIPTVGVSKKSIAHIWLMIVFLSILVFCQCFFFNQYLFL
jgi:hypothetical protein